MLLEVERDKAITDRVILLQKVIRGFKDRSVSVASAPLAFPLGMCSAHLCSHTDTGTSMHSRGAHTEAITHAPSTHIRSQGHPRIAKLYHVT